MTRRVSLLLCVPLVVMCLGGCIVVSSGKKAPQTTSQSGSRGVYSVRTDPYHGRGKGPPAHAPAHGRRRHFNYIYYPGSQVYYCPQRKRYFWYRERQWRSGTALPKTIIIDRGRGVVVKSEDSMPYRDHAKFARQHPGRDVGNVSPRPSQDQPPPQRHSPGFPDEPDQPEPREENAEPAPADPGPSDPPAPHDDDDDESNGSGHGKGHTKGKGKGHSKGNGKGHEKHDDDDDRGYEEDEDGA